MALSFRTKVLVAVGVAAVLAGCKSLSDVTPLPDGGSADFDGGFVPEIEETGAPPSDAAARAEAEAAAEAGDRGDVDAAVDAGEAGSD